MNLKQLIGKTFVAKLDSYYLKPKYQSGYPFTKVSGIVEKVIPKGQQPEVDNIYVRENSPINKPHKLDRICYVDSLTRHHITAPISEKPTGCLVSYYFV